MSVARVVEANDGAMPPESWTKWVIPSYEYLCVKVESQDTFSAIFPLNTPVQDGFEYVDIDEQNMAVCWVYGDEKSGELFELNMHNRCLAELNKNGYVRKEDDWCMERYTCPRYTAPDEKGNVILDYCISVV